MFELFIRRPILSTVISVFITLLGILALTSLPITQFPDIVPPSVTVTARYTGANSEVLSKAVATPLERAISSAGGVLLDEMTTDYMLRRLPGVFVAGEMLDWEAPTGGFLLQACFATGRAAGAGVVRRLRADTP